MDLLRKGGINPVARISWWRYRLPGLGSIKWNEFFSVLQEAGYQGAMSIEQSDPFYEFKDGLIMAETLPRSVRPCLGVSPMVHRIALCLIATATLGAAADWNPRLAADYLDAREKEWFAFKPANAAGGPCLSCHTSMAYLLARPALRKALGEGEPTNTKPVCAPVCGPASRRPVPLHPSESSPSMPRSRSSSTIPAWGPRPARLLTACGTFNAATVSSKVPGPGST